MYLLLMMYLIVACNYEDQEPGIDLVFIPFVDSFLEEANIRGISLDSSQISSIQFGDTDFGGVCFRNSGNILINEDSWNKRTDFSKEFLIFHELGHCVLDRRHDNGVLPNGLCKSLMMGSGENMCRYNFNDIWLGYLTDELFDPNTPLPDWFLTEVNTVSTETLIDTVGSSVRNMFIDIPTEKLTENFELIAEYIDWRTNTNIHLVFGEYELEASDNQISIRNGTNILFFLQEPILPNTLTLRVVKRNGFVYILYDHNVFLIDSFDIDITTGVFLSLENGTQTALHREMRFQLRNIEG